MSTGMSNYPVPLRLSDNYVGALDSLLWLQEMHEWADYLLSFSEARIVITILLEKNIGNFSVLESNTEFQRWIWLSPEAVQCVMESDPSLLDSVDASNLDIMQIYRGILSELGRDAKGRRKDASHLATR